MKSGGPWNLRGLRPETREAARDAARRSGVSVGEWLNSVIRRDDEDDDFDEPMPASVQDRDDDDGWRDYDRSDYPGQRRRAPPRETRREAHREPPYEPHRDFEDDDRPAVPPARRDPFGEDDESPRVRQRDGEREQGLQRREREIDRQASRAREEFGEVHARLDRLTQQLDRMSRGNAQRLTGSPAQPSRGRVPPHAPRPLANPAAEKPALSVDDAVAQIAERQRALYGSDIPTAPAPPTAPPEMAVQAPPPFEAPPRPEPNVDISNLEDQLRYITTRIEALRPSSELERIVKGFRQDLADIRQQLTEALPKRAVESLEIEVQALAQRLDHSRGTGVDSGVLAGLEQGLAEVRDALRALTPAENLVGFDDAVRTLAQKVDLILAKEDPAALQQLETAIGALRGIVSHVASNDTLTKVAEDVRALAAKVDRVANTAVTEDAFSSIASRLDTLTQAMQVAVGGGADFSTLESRIETLTHALQTSPGVVPDLSGLEQRIETLTQTVQASPHGGQDMAGVESRIEALTNALSASAEAGHAVPHELEKLLSGLIEKLEWVQLTHTDHAALGTLEDRIAQHIKRLDASDAKLGNLEAVERGLADLLVHLDQLRSSSNGPIAAMQTPAAVDAIERNVAEIRQGERRTQDALEAVQGAIEHVVDRLATIESGMHEVSRRPLASIPLQPAQPSPVEAPVAEPVAEAAAAAWSAPARTPIDPTLPPDHPLEPGFGPSARATPSAAERIAASEAAAELAAPPVSAEPAGEKQSFIAAARRAAQAAAAAPPERQRRGNSGSAYAGEPSRLRKLLVAGGAVLVAAGCMHIALHIYQERSPGGSHNASPPASQRQPAPHVPAPRTGSVAPIEHAAPQVLTVPDSSSGEAPSTIPGGATHAPTGSPASTPSPGAASSGGASKTRPATPPAATQERQSALPQSGDITGSLPHHAPTPEQTNPPAAIATAPLPAIAAHEPANLAPESRGTASAPAAETAGALPAGIGGAKLRSAALGGNAAAEYEIGARFADGQGVPRNDEAARHWLELAAKQGVAPAQFRLGGLYEKGIGVKKSLTTARDFYAAAAAKGNGKAMHNLAVLYAEGIDGPPDYAIAAQWFRKAAEHGISDSQYNLAILYARGIGVEQSFAEAYKWFALAADKGDGEAAKKRDDVAAHLDAQALAAAKADVAKWRPEPQPAEALDVKAPPGGWDQAERAAKAKPRSTDGKPLPISVN